MVVAVLRKSSAVAFQVLLNEVDMASVPKLLLQMFVVVDVFCLSVCLTSLNKDRTAPQRDGLSCRRF